MKKKNTCRLTWSPLILVVASGLSFWIFSFPSTAQNPESQRQLKHEPVKTQKKALEHRVALIIGNGAYQNANRLANPANDAEDMATSLRALGFELVGDRAHVNQSADQMRQLIVEFGQALSMSGGVGLFYYAGHGVQARGRNYMIPVEAKILREKTLEFDAVDLNRVLTEIDAANNGFNIVILDACRNSPFTRSWRDASQGLAQVDAPEGTLIAYATSPGRVANDGDGRNGAYTAELLRQIRTPGLSIEEMFKAVRANVKLATNNQQTPWESSSLVGQFYFAGPMSNSNPTNSRVSGGKIDAAAVEREYWETIRNSSEAQDFKDYVGQYPNGAYAAIAQMKIRRLEASKNAASSSHPADATAKNMTSKTESRQPGKLSSNESVGSNGIATMMPPNPVANLRSFEFLTATLDSSSNLKNRDHKSAYLYTEDLGGIKLEMVAIPPGEFMMGSPETEIGRKQDEGPQHRVRLNYWFYMGKFEVTQAQWRAVMGNSPSYFKDCDECPVEEVSWYDAVDFCNKLSTLSGHQYRLPTEAEWEYAARAGTTTPFALGDTISLEIVNYNAIYPYPNAAKATSRDKTTPAGGLGVANGFGLYDMLGNVLEWCQDWYHDNYGGIANAPADGSAWMTGGEQKSKVLRGGSWNYAASRARSADRGKYLPGLRGFFIGFRVVTVR